MRLAMTLFKQYRRGNKPARAPQDMKKIPFKPILPLELRDRVSGKGDGSDHVPCLHELSILFASLKDNDFDERQCKDEIEKLNKAFTQSILDSKEKKFKNTGETITVGKNLTSLQLNKYLRKFPIKATK